MNPESKFKIKVMKDLKTLGKIWILKTQEKGRRGVPDLLICLNGQFVAIELKAEKKEPDPLQMFELNCIESASGLALVAYPENWKEIFKKLAMQSRSE